MYSDEKDPKKGISQNDLYQMLAYSIRFNVEEIILFYPNTLKQTQEEETELTIKDTLADGKEIVIRAFRLPIINRELLHRELVAKTDLSELFESTREGLKKNRKNTDVDDTDTELKKTIKNRFSQLTIP